MSYSPDQVYDMISSASTDGMDEFLTMFAYEGFNPEMVHRHFASIMESQGISQGEFVNDMRALITLGALKGNYTMRNSGKISEAGKAKADLLYSKYRMKIGSLGGDKKAIILPRVLSAFPELTTKVILRSPDRNFGTITNGLPKLFKNPVFPALVPHGLSNKVVDTLLWIYTVYSAEQSMAISTVKDFGDAFTAQKQFVTIAYNSTHPVEPTRVRMMKASIEDIASAVSGAKEYPEKPPGAVGAAEARAAVNALSG